MKKITLILCLLGVYFSNGQLMDGVQIPNSSDTYAVYLPEQYSEVKKWPVIMVFSPVGKAIEAVEHFRESADRYGYVIASPNAVKNGNYQENLLRSRTFYSEVINRFSIDKNAIYLAGFSGGARLAVSIAVMSSQIKGVIASGASFSNVPGYMPKENKFFYIGMVGDQDFNYNEMLQAMDYLEQKKFDANLLVFSGGHKWPPANYIDKAVRLVSVKAINKGIMEAGKDKVDEYFKMELGFNQDLMNENLIYRAYKDMELNQTNYRFNIEKDSLRDLVKTIRKHKNFRKQRNNWNEIRRIEPYKYMDYLRFLPQDISSGELESMPYWEQQVDSIKNNFLRSPIRARRNFGSRLLSFLEVACVELATSYTSDQQLDNLLYIAILQTLIDEKNYDAYLRILRITVKKSQYGMALYYLDKMLKNGFKDTPLLDHQDEIALLRIQPEYNDLLESYGLEVRY